MIDYIYHDGQRYDRMFSRDNPDLDFWARLAAQYGDPVLELACGTGRVAIRLAEAGFRVTGLDQAPAMLEEARRKAAAAGVKVDWVQGDMRSFDLARPFPLIILPANALCHLLDLASFQACLACVRQHLAPDGRFVIDVFVPDAALLIPRPGERLPLAEYDEPDGQGHVVVTHSYVYEPDSQIKRITTYRVRPDQGEEVEGTVDMRMYYPQELEALLKYNGFRVDAKYGDYDLTPFGSTAGKQLIVCSVASRHETRP